MTTVDQRLAIGSTFKTRERADSAMAALRAADFSDDDLGFVMRSEDNASNTLGYAAVPEQGGDQVMGLAMQDREKTLGNAGYSVVSEPTAENTPAPTDHVHHKDDVGAVAGGATGAVTGGAVAGVMAAGMIPGVGPILVGGMLVSVVGSAVVGALTGGIAAALVHLGVAEDDARYYEGEFKEGRPVVSVHTSTRLVEAREILLSHGGIERVV